MSLYVTDLGGTLKMPRRVHLLVSGTDAKMPAVEKGLDKMQRAHAKLSPCEKLG